MADTVTQATQVRTLARNTNRRARGYAVTINNPSEDDIKAFEGINCYWIYQIESGANNTTHLQGFLYFGNPVSFNSLKGKLNRAHIEVARNKEASINYCQKVETRINGPFTNKPDWIRNQENPDTVTQRGDRNLRGPDYWIEIFNRALAEALHDREMNRS